MAGPSLPRRVWAALADYASRLWDIAGEDNISFLAGAIAFNILLAAVPFVLLLLSGLGYLLHQSTAESSASLFAFVDSLLPPHAEGASSPVHRLLDDIVRARGSVGLVGAIAFVWFSTRLFGTLRSVLGEVFDIEVGRSVIAGKVFDIQITVLSTFLFAMYTALTAYLRLATSHLVELSRVGMPSDVIGKLEYWIGTGVATAFIVLMFFSIYKFLPNRHIRWQSAAIAAVFTGVLFELAKIAFTAYLSSFNPGSLYTGTLAAIVIVVLWVYYCAWIFVLGGEVGRVYELRRAIELQRETFE
ncbi:MAG TPA: YihY/virulence factor BrkB family protein [Gemmatimonadaceae bacterium]|nr:YihY/virulence factor BrkB family protein [Gemmatimonadaceae bacterium]